MSANTAMDMAVSEGINVKRILTHEDIAPGADAPIEDRRGLSGCIPLVKIAGAAAEAGKSLDEILAIAERKPVIFFLQNFKLPAFVLTKKRQ